MLVNVARNGEADDNDRASARAGRYGEGDGRRDCRLCRVVERFLFREGLEQTVRLVCCVGRRDDRRCRVPVNDGLVWGGED